MTILEQKQVAEAEIRVYLRRMKAHGEDCALWGAGKKGRAFCEKMDPRGEYIKYVFDKDEVKTNNIITIGGHRVCSWRDNFDKVRSIFLVMQSFAGETIRTLRDAGYTGDFISVNDWIVGGLNSEAQRQISTPILNKIKKTRIGGLVIWYEPSQYEVDNILSYINDVDCLYIFDNSKKSHLSLITKIQGKEKIKYYHEGKNRGLGYPINKIAEVAIEDNVEWLITFDQDSRPAKNMINMMRQYVESDMYNFQVSMVVPVVLEPIGMQEEAFDNLPYLSCISKTVQSGAMHKVEDLRKIRYNEEYFIDNVDFNFCVRSREFGKKIVRINRARLYHQESSVSTKTMEAEGFKFYVNKYSPSRYYYQYRNMLYDAKYFLAIDPDYVLECQMGLRKIEVMSKYEQNRKSCEKAIRCAKDDFQKGIVGVWDEQRGI